MSEFAGRTLVVATMHGKERAIAPLLEERLGVRCVVPEGLDTDRFGTFTREVPRAGDMREAARAKALAGMRLVGADLGVASEGSFGPDPAVPFLPSNRELLLLCDTRHGYEIPAQHRSLDTNLASAWVKSCDEAAAFAERVGFPQHGVIARLDERSPAGLEKAIRNVAELQGAVEELLDRAGGPIFLETDMRAHRNPTRMQVIAGAASSLLDALEAICPCCAAPGFVVSELRRGLPCSWCGSATQLPREEVRSCTPCGATREAPSSLAVRGADPRYCDWCNP